MTNPSNITIPPMALGVTSLVLGVIASLLFFLPILGIPLSVCAVLIGVIGLIASAARPKVFLRWSLIGLAASCLALAINLAIVYAPVGYLRDQNVPRPWQSVPDRPSAPPPARQR